MIGYLPKSKNTRWLYFVVALAFLYPVFASVEGWPTGPVTIVISVWCVWRVASVLIRGKIPAKSDWSVTVGVASAGIVFLFFLLLGYRGTAAVSPVVLFAAQVMGLAGTFALEEMFVRRFGTGIRDKQLKSAKPYEGSMVKFISMMVLLLLPTVTLVAAGIGDRSRIEDWANERFIAFSAHDAGILIWLSAMTGAMIGHLVLQAIFLRFKVEKEKALKKKEWDAYVRQSRLDRTGENGNPDRPD